QVTAIFQESNEYEAAHTSLLFCEKLNASVVRSDPLSQIDRFNTLRRRAQIFSHQTPDDARFGELLRPAEELATSSFGRLITLMNVRGQRWLRQRTYRAATQAYEQLTPLAEHYRGVMFHNGRVIRPDIDRSGVVDPSMRSTPPASPSSDIALADLSELFLAVA